MCVPEGGSNIELMAPANPSLPLSQSLQKFLDRRGDGLYALMLEAPDPDAEAVELADRGVEVLPLMAGASGRDIHPRSTHGVLIRVYPNDSVPRQDGTETTEPHLSGISRVIVATDDVAGAAQAYGTGLGLAVGPVERDEERGVTRALCTPPKGGVIELVAAADTTKPFAADIARFVANRKPGMFALVLSAEDPKAAAATLLSRGAQPGENDLEFSAFGARLIIE